MDVWDIWGLGGSPEFFAGGGDPLGLPLLSMGAAAPALTGINTSSFGPWDAIAQIGSSAATALFSPQIATGPFDPKNNLPVIVQDLQKLLQGNTGITTTTTVGASQLPCFVHKSGPLAGQMVRSRRRQRIKLVRQPDGSLTPTLYCAPKRMNALNPRALSRAARRLASFQRIAHGIDAMINRQICRKSSSRKKTLRIPSYGRRSTSPRCVRTAPGSSLYRCG